MRNIFYKKKGLRCCPQILARFPSVGQGMALSDRWGDGGWKSQWSPEVETGVVRTRYANPIRQPLRSIGWSTCPPKQRIAGSNPEVHKRSGCGATNQAEDGIISEIHHQSAVISH